MEILKVCMIALLACVYLEAFAEVVSSNLLVNPSFSKGQEGWHIPNINYSISNNVGRDDNASLYLKLDSNSPYVLAQQAIDAKPGHWYAFSAWVKLSNVAGGGARICIEWSTENGYYGGFYPILDLTGTSDWQHVSFITPKSPEKVKKAHLVLYASYPTTGEIWFDDAELREISASPIVVDFPKKGREKLAVYSKLQPEPITISIKPTDFFGKIIPGRRFDPKDVNIIATASQNHINYSRLAEIAGNAEITWDENAAKLSVPTNDLLLGDSKITIVLADKNFQKTFFVDEQHLDVDELIRLDIVEPSSMGVVNFGPNKVKCLLTINSPEIVESKTHKIRLYAKDRNGNPIGKSVELASKEISNAYFSVDGLQLGVYDLCADVLDEKGETIARSSRLLTVVDPAKRPANVTEVLPTGMIKVDNQIMFPLGIYIISALDRIPGPGEPWEYSQERKNRDYYLSVLDLFIKSPLNCLIDYTTLSGGVEDTRDFLDEAHKRGVKVIFNVKDDVVAAIRNNLPLDGSVSVIGNQLAALKEHPAIFAVYHNDEAWEPNVIDYYALAYRQIREIDPWHPCYSVHYMYPLSKHLEKSTDVMGTDPYVLMNNISEAVKSWRACQSALGPGRPNWAVVQTFGAGFESSNPDDVREPTYDEMRSGTFCAIAEGATGIVFYCLHSMQRSPKFTSRWRDLCQIAAEVKDLTPIIALPDSKTKVQVAKGEICVKAKADDKKVYLIVASPVRVDQQVAIKIPKAKMVKDYKTGEAFKLAKGVCEFTIPALGARILIAE